MKTCYTDCMNIIEQKLEKNKMEIVDIGKLYIQHKAGLSIRKLSIIWNLPYSSLYRALKKVDKRKKKNEPAS